MSISNSWSRAVATTLEGYMWGYEEMLIRNHKWTALLEREGRIELDCKGIGINWAVGIARGNVTPNRGDEALVFSPISRFQRASLDNRGYVATDFLSLKDYLENRGKYALIDYYEQMAPQLAKDIEEQLAVEVYQRGQSDPRRFWGLESMMYQNAQSIKNDDGTIRSYNAADPVAAPADTYGGLSTALGYFGGSIANGVWPNDFQANNDGFAYDCYSPVLVNYNSSYFGGATNTWKDQCTDAMRFLITALEKDNSKLGTIDTIFLSRDLYRQFKTKNDPLQRIQVSSNTGLRALGFRDVIELDGVEVTSDYGIPSKTGYGFNTRHLTMRSLFDRIIKVNGPYYHDQTQGYRTSGIYLGGMYADSPKFFGKLYAYAGVAG